MPRAVVIADGVSQRAASRAQQLELDGWTTRLARDPSQAHQLVPGADVLMVGEFQESPALAYELVRDLRAGRIAKADPSLRVVATADTEAQMISALAAGADLTVPGRGSGTLVSASVAAVSRRAASSQAERVVKVGSVEIDAEGRRVTVDGEPIRLSGKELDVLVALADKPGRVLSRDEISWKVWGGPDIKSSRSLDTHVSRMAGKFRAAGADGVVENVWGRGYKLTGSGPGVER